MSFLTCLLKKHREASSSAWMICFTWNAVSTKHRLSWDRSLGTHSVLIQPSCILSIMPFKAILALFRINDL